MFESSPIQRCNAVAFGSNLCEEAKVTQLENVSAGESEKDFLIRSNDERLLVFNILKNQDLKDNSKMTGSKHTL